MHIATIATYLTLEYSVGHLWLAIIANNLIAWYSYLVRQSGLSCMFVIALANCSQAISLNPEEKSCS